MSERKIVRAFLKLRDFELFFSVEANQAKYDELLHDVCSALGVSPLLVAPLNLAAEAPPEWIAEIDELAYYWKAAHLAYLERVKTREMIERVRARRTA